MDKNTLLVLKEILNSDSNYECDWKIDKMWAYTKHQCKINNLRRNVYQSLFLFDISLLNI